jgi:hypothetical protein
MVLSEKLLRLQGTNAEAIFRVPADNDEVSSDVFHYSAARHALRMRRENVLNGRQLKATSMNE